MNFFDRFSNILQKLLPSPFTIAVLLTVIVFLTALVFSCPSDMGYDTYAVDLIGSWESGLWQEGGGGLYFAFQMMLILILGHVLALTPFVSGIIDALLKHCKDTATSTLVITFSTILVAYFNWGLGLIFGAILARKIGEKFSRLGQKLNYALIGACGYVGMMVWHGGLSGSAPTKANEQNNIHAMFGEGEQWVKEIPNSVSIDETIMSSMNITAGLILLLLIPAVMYFFARRSTKDKVPELSQKEEKSTHENRGSGLGVLDHTLFLPLLLGGTILFYAFYKAFILPEEPSLKIITPNYLNFILLGLGLLLHKRISHFLKAVDTAITGASGILIQFPLYFGMMAMLRHSGMIEEFSGFFVSIATDDTFPIFTFFSAGLVNLFVPSGGGQWAVQGPIIIQAAYELNVSYSKTIMALSYGDQLTNMLQPFWALPLLGITGLKAREILPYTLLLFLIGLIVFILVLLIF